MLFDLRAIETSLETFESLSYPPIATSPTVLVPNPATRRQLNEPLAVLRHEVDETVFALTRVQERIDVLLRGLRGRSAALVNVAAPVSGLPVELLQQIFLIYAADTRTSKSSIILSHVSSRWRSVAVNLPELWNVIQVRPDQPSGMVALFLSRSADLRVHISASHRRLNQYDLTGLTPENAHRVSSMSNVDDLTKHSTALWRQCVPNFEIDTLKVGPGEKFPPLAHCAGDPLHVRDLHLQRHIWDLPQTSDTLPQLVMERLTRLEIADSHHLVMLDTVRGLVMPNLEVLEIRGMLRSDDFHYAGEMGATFLCLRHLVARSCHDMIVWNIITFWMMPILLSAELDFSTCYNGLLGNLGRLLRRSVGIRRIVLTIPASTSRQVYDLLLDGNAPALHDLAIILAPHSMLDPSGDFEDTSSILRAILQRRLESPNLCPIETLTLSEHLAGKELQWLEQNTTLTQLASDNIWTVEEQDSEYLTSTVELTV